MKTPYWLDRRRSLVVAREKRDHRWVCDWCNKSWRTRFFYWLHWSWLGEVK